MSRVSSRYLPTALGLSVALAAAALAGPPDFTVESAESKFRLSDARGQFVALHFLMKTECPLCQKHVAETTRRAPELAGLVHVFLKPDSEAEIAAWSSKLREAGIAATIYRDADAKLASAFQIPDGYAFHGESVHYPALVLIGPDGNEVFRYVGKSNADRMPFDALAAKLAELTRSGSVGQYNLSEGALALKGHDPVAYFESGKAEIGRSDLFSQYRGVVYRFATPERRQKFAATPSKYVPTYGGWCATAMAEGRKVEIDPTNFKVTDGRLFLFYKGWLGNALNDWNKDERKLTTQADEHWRKLAPTDVDLKK